MKGQAGRPVEDKSVANGNQLKTTKGSNQRAYTISRLQRERPDLFELVKLMPIVDKRNEEGRPKGNGKTTQSRVVSDSSEETAKVLGISSSKVDQMRTIIDHGDPETIAVT